MNARCHPDRPEHSENYGDDHFCTECFFKAWNAGAAWSDAHWADDPKPAWEMTPWGLPYQPESKDYNANAIFTRMTKESKEKPE